MKFFLSHSHTNKQTRSPPPPPPLPNFHSMHVQHRPDRRTVGNVTADLQKHLTLSFLAEHGLPTPVGARNVQLIDPRRHPECRAKTL